MGRAHVGELCKCIVGDSNDEDGGGNELVEVALRMLANLVRAEKDVVINDKKTMERVRKIALGNERKQAKFAARFLVLNPSSGVEATRQMLQVCFDLNVYD